MSETLANGRYEVVRRLATGGMGEVLLAEFKGDKEISAGLLVVKRILSVAPGQPPAEGQVKMLKEEGRLGLRLMHGNLVETFRIEEGTGSAVPAAGVGANAGPLLVIELLAGRSMAQVLGQAKKRKEAVPVDVALAVLRGSCCGLHFAHTLKSPDGENLGIVHRDVSPANIFVTFDGRVKVIDFGVAKSEDSEIKTATGILKGKLGYMSPEQSLGAGKLTPQADVWSLGVFFWEMLVAERLFSSPNPTATLLQISQKELVGPRFHRPDVPPAVEQICMTMLERDLDRRYYSCADVARAIDALPGGGGVPRVNVGAFLAGRFPDEAESGSKEASRCARMTHKAPVPQGLVDGDAGDALGDEPATTVLSADVRAQLIKAASAEQDVATSPSGLAAPARLALDPRAASLDDDAATVRVTADIVAMARAEAGLRPGARVGNVAADEDLIATSAVGASTMAAVRGGPLPVNRPGPGEASATTRNPLPAHTATEPQGPSISGFTTGEASAPVPRPSLVPQGGTDPRRARAPTAVPPPAPPISNLDRARPITNNPPQPTTTTTAPVAAPVARPAKPTSWLAVALSTFGALVLVMGVAFSFAIARPVPRAFVAFADPAGFDVVVGDPSHAPGGQPWRLIDPLNATLLKAGDPQPKAVLPAELQARLTETGVWTRAALPATTRTKFAALLPVLIAALGLLALAFAVPAFVIGSARPRLAVRVILLLAVVGAAVVIVEDGALSWPGRAAWREQPRLEWR
ncbi:MAG: serine/threonine-protein kinase [Deltaproteobacteria bacterium]|nr:serine/threonine-protein kinase [Deltaproteobacteria bacterium]